MTCQRGPASDSIVGCKRRSHSTVSDFMAYNYPANPYTTYARPYICLTDGSAAMQSTTEVTSNKFAEMT